MKIALIGTGKTGQYLLQGHQHGILSKDDEIIPFNTKQIATEEALSKADVAIIFVPGKAALDLIPLILKAKLPCAWGSTGLTWPLKDLEVSLKDAGISWIRGSNFSLGMGIIKGLLKELKVGLPLFSHPVAPHLQMIETHHTGKKDAPSGTALSWKDWLGLDIPIESKRVGDVVGEHELILTTKNEIITIKHQALDRKLFAQGAYWAAMRLFNKEVPPGFYSFDQVMELYLEKRNVQTGHL